jgi:hypothetical protein
MQNFVLRAAALIPYFISSLVTICFKVLILVLA